MNLEAVLYQVRTQNWLGHVSRIYDNILWTVTMRISTWRWDHMKKRDLGGR